MPTDMYQTLDTISSSQHYNQWIYSQVEPHLRGDILDIGSGIGDIVDFYKRSSARKIHVSDYSYEMMESLSRRFENDERYQAWRMDITDGENIRSFGHNRVDTITCMNVLEHIEDHRMALENMYRLLKPGGKLVLIVPAVQAIYGTLDDLVGHYRRYRRRTMRAVVANTNFMIEQQYYMNMFGIVTWFVSGRILKQKKFHKNACLRLDKIVPALRSFERLIPPPVGQSLVTVCVKE